MFWLWLAVITGVAPGIDLPLTLRRHLSAVSSSDNSKKQYPAAPLHMQEERPAYYLPHFGIRNHSLRLQ